MSLTKRWTCPHLLNEQIPTLRSHTYTVDWEKTLRISIKPYLISALGLLTPCENIFQQKSILTSYFLRGWDCFDIWNCLCKCHTYLSGSSVISLAFTMFSDFSLYSDFLILPLKSHGPWNLSALLSTLQSSLTRLGASYLCGNCKCNYLQINIFLLSWLNSWNSTFILLHGGTERRSLSSMFCQQKWWWFEAKTLKVLSLYDMIAYIKELLDNITWCFWNSVILAIKVNIGMIENNTLSQTPTLDSSKLQEY